MLISSWNIARVLGPKPQPATATVQAQPSSPIHQVKAAQLRSGDDSVSNMLSEQAWESDLELL